MIGREILAREFKGLLKDGSLGHNYIFFGPSRAGKTFFARNLANHLEKGEFAEPGTLNDFLYIVPDENAVIGIDRIREIKGFLAQFPNMSSRRTVVVKDAEAMTTEAQNALLKIAEEPPAGGLIIIIVSDPEALLPTLRSRFQKIFFEPLDQKTMEKLLTTEMKIPGREAKNIILRSAGLPGLAYAFLKDPVFKAVTEKAEQILKLKGSERKAFLKELVDDESFRLDIFLEALAFVLYPLKPTEAPFWHNLLSLRSNAAYFNLNPRLQLSALFEKWKS